MSFMFPLRPHVVTVQWLLDSFTKGSLLPEAGYLHPDCLPLAPDGASVTANRAPTSRPSAVPEVASPSTPRHKRAEEDLLSQYMDDDPTVGKYLSLMDLLGALKVILSHTVMLLLSFLFYPPVDMPPPAEGKDSTVAEPQPEIGAPNQTRGQEPDSTLQEPSEAGLFFGKCFLLVGFSTEAEAQLSLLVTENGGRVLMGRTRVVADYAVVPLLGCSVEATVDEVVTDTWLVGSSYCFRCTSV